MSSKANVAPIVDRAIAAAGGLEFESRSFEPGLAVLLEDLDHSPYLQPPGRAFLESIYVGLLAARLRVEDYARRHPEVQQARVKKPVIVVGMPRTGTTLLSYLLGADLNRRSLLKWELSDGIPPASTETLRTDPRCLAMKAQESARQGSSVHHEVADGPTECTFVVASDFKSLFLDGIHPVPRYHEWVLQADMTSAYGYHKLLLQVLQSKAPGVWNLKMPSHSLYVTQLLQAYPDARIVWTHRDPFQVAGSLCSLISGGHRLATTEDTRAYIAARYPRQLAAHVDRAQDAVDAGLLHAGNLHHVHYHDLVTDPLAAMNQLYDWLGDELTGQAQSNMRAWLAANPQARFGKHDYKLDDYGLSPQKLQPYFERYLAHHQIEREG